MAALRLTSSLLWLSLCQGFTSGQNLTCRICNQASSLDDCTTSVSCSSDKACFMDELVTTQLAVVYNGGCRSKALCSSTLPFGKRELSRRAGNDTGLVSCRRCCTAVSHQGEPECNTRLCGIRHSSPPSLHCYLCDDQRNDAAQGDVAYPEDCLSQTECGSNEACGAIREISGSSMQQYRYTCMPKGFCMLQTTEALKRKDECMTNPDPRLCGDQTGRRRAVEACKVCCGDELCNTGSCDEILERLYKLWKGNVLDLMTLKIISHNTTSTAIIG